MDETRCSRVEDAFESEDTCRQSFKGDEADGRGATSEGRDSGHRSWPSPVSVLAKSRLLGLPFSTAANFRFCSSRPVDGQPSRPEVRPLPQMGVLTSLHQARDTAVALPGLAKLFDAVEETNE
jgi:hypothetical protein